MMKAALSLALFGTAINGQDYGSYQQTYNPVYNDYGAQVQGPDNYGNQQKRLVDLYSKQSRYSGSNNNNLENYGGLSYEVPDYSNSGYQGYPVYGGSSNNNNYAPDYVSYADFFPKYESYGSSKYDGFSKLLNMNNNNYDVASTGSGSNIGNSKTDAAYKGTQVDVRTNGYDQAVGYKGNELWTGTNGAVRGYVKGEGYEQGGYSGFDKAEDHSGLAYAEKQNVGVNHNVNYEVDHSSNFKNDYNDENHAGNYKGNEFDVGYKATDVNGGYYNDQKEVAYKGSAYDGSEHSGTQNNGGQYDGSDYTKYGGAEEEENYREYAVVDNDDFSPEQENFQKGGNLYEKYSGTAPEEAYTKENMGDWYVRPNVYRKSGEYSKDQYSTAYGADFEGKDYFENSNQNEGYVGAEEATSTKGAYDKGQYRDVAAQGYNKEAQYQGDYQTNQKTHDVDYNVKHFEDLQIDFGTDAEKDQYLEQYKGADYKGGYEAEKNYGDYNDAEFAKEFDETGHMKNYNGESFSNGVDVDASIEQYYGAQGDKNQYQSNYQYPTGDNYERMPGTYGYGGYRQTSQQYGGQYGYGV